MPDFAAFPSIVSQQTVQFQRRFLHIHSAELYIRAVLDLQRLRALCAVVDSGSVTAAAAILGYTPSAVSQLVSALERETGAALLERVGRGVRPTESGVLLAAHAEDILARVAAAEVALAAFLAGETGVLRIVSFPTAGAALIPPAVAAVRGRLPAIEISFRVAEYDDALAMIRLGEADVAILEVTSVAASAPESGVVYRDLLEDPFRLVLPRGHRLARRRSIRLAELAEESWVDVVFTVGRGQHYQREVQEAYRRAGFAPRRSIETDEYWPAQGFVAAGLGVALIPTLALEVLHDGVVVRRLHRSDEPVRRVRIATRPATEDRLPVRLMIQALDDAACAHLRAHGAIGRASRTGSLAGSLAELRPEPERSPPGSAARPGPR